MTKCCRNVKKPWFRKPAIKVSERMRRVNSIGTSIEKCFERLLKYEGIKYKKQPRLIGKPDFQIRNSKIVVFCDSSFWHGRRKKEITGEAFKKNKEFWVNKLTENRKRDLRVNRALKKDGWHILRFWDTDILKHLEKVKKKILLEIEKND